MIQKIQAFLTFEEILDDTLPSEPSNNTKMFKSTSKIIYYYDDQAQFLRGLSFLSIDFR